MRIIFALIGLIALASAQTACDACHNKDWKSGSDVTQECYDAFKGTNCGGDAQVCETCAEFNNGVNDDCFAAAGGPLSQMCESQGAGAQGAGAQGEGAQGAETGTQEAVAQVTDAPSRGGHGHHGKHEKEEEAEPLSLGAACAIAGKSLGACERTHECHAYGAVSFCVPKGGNFKVSCEDAPGVVCSTLEGCAWDHNECVSQGEVEQAEVEQAEVEQAEVEEVECEDVRTEVACKAAPLCMWIMDEGQHVCDDASEVEAPELEEVELDFENEAVEKYFRHQKPSHSGANSGAAAPASSGDGGSSANGTGQLGKTHESKALIDWRVLLIGGFLGAIFGFGAIMAYDRMKTQTLPEILLERV